MSPGILNAIYKVVKNDKIGNPFPITSGQAVTNEGQESQKKPENYRFS